MPEHIIYVPSDKIAAILPARDIGMMIWQREDYQWVIEGDAQLAAACQVFIDHYDPLLNERIRLKSEIDAEADRRVLQKIPGSSQRMLTARGLELLDKKQHGGKLTDAEEADAEHVRSIGRLAREIRAKAEAAKTIVDSLRDSADVESFKPDDDVHWR